MTIAEVLTRDDKFKYMLLGRMQSDCQYYLENNHPKHLWAGSPEKQIEYMKAIWHDLSKKPEWLSIEDIEEFERRLTVVLTA